MMSPSTFGWLLEHRTQSHNLTVLLRYMFVNHFLPVSYEEWLLKMSREEAQNRANKCAEILKILLSIDATEKHSIFRIFWFQKFYNMIVLNDAVKMTFDKLF